MMLKKFLYVIALICVCTTVGNSQARKWETYTSMKEIKDIEIIRVQMKYSAQQAEGLFEVDMQSGNVKKKFTNVDGLLSVDILSVKLDNHNKIWIGASDGSISIYDYQNGTWNYIYDIKNSTEADKSINDFLLHGNYMYVATGYGIQKISTDNYNFVDAPYSQLGQFPANNTKVNKLTLWGNMFFAATDAGIAYASNINSNLNNPLSWTNYNNTPLNSDVGAIETFDNKVFCGSPVGCQYFDGTNFANYPSATFNQPA